MLLIDLISILCKCDKVVLITSLTFFLKEYRYLTFYYTWFNVMQYYMKEAKILNPAHNMFIHPEYTNPFYHNHIQRKCTYVSE